ncbi:hypothetical protein [Deminuibacter soli]|uniref:hypothetical protein n=1 Tax=Deminuibacter soli TaxID=2291815 RepID=UPI001314C6E1|nr:hypothetical protein [Deminuibacter soli]
MLTVCGGTLAQRQEAAVQIIEMFLAEVVKGGGLSSDQAKELINVNPNGRGTQQNGNP